MAFASADPAWNVPQPGPLWGIAPQRRDDTGPPWHKRRWGGPKRHYADIVTQAQQAMSSWTGLDAAAHGDALRQLRAGLRKHGLTPERVAQALGCVAAAATRALASTPFTTQLFSAAVLLDNRMAEMATGEGKTLTAALAAAVGALAGIPVHVVTANEYLAARDAQTMAPLFAALGLECAYLNPALDADAKRSVYARDIVYATAKELAFDHLRERLAQGPARHELEYRAAALVGDTTAPPVMRGLCMAILDEADSILLDEADIPLILSRSVSQADRRAFLWQALSVARRLDLDVDFKLHAADQRVHLTPRGADRVAQLTATLEGPWRRARYRAEAVTVALKGLHAYRRGEHYLVRDDRVDILDAVTGRAAPGRVWSRGLHTVIEMKEGCTPSPDTETLSQITFQRFFLRYLRLCGMSGTLREARSELREVYGVGVVRVPLRRPSLRRELPTRMYPDDESRWAAVAERVLALRSLGRPVLVGTDSVTDSQALSTVLMRAGIAHEVLNALQDREEARIVALAGQAGRVTVATHMAGRGTDIALDDSARVAGGLHVLSCQHNASRRLDRQLAGRAARQGEPGSTEAWLLARKSPHGELWLPRIVTRWNRATSPVIVPVQALLVFVQRIAQQRHEAHHRALRAALLRQDLEWHRRLSFAGLEP